MFQYEKIASFIAVGVQEGQTESAVQEWRLQHRPGKRIETSAAVLAGPVHHTGGRSMAMDPVRVRHEFPAQLARFWHNLVPDRLHSRRPDAREHRQPVVVAVRNQHENVHGQFLVQRGDAAYHGVRLPHGHGRMSRGYSVFLFPEHRWFDDPSTLSLINDLFNILVYQ